MSTRPPRAGSTLSYPGGHSDPSGLTADDDNDDDNNEEGEDKDNKEEEEEEVEERDGRKRCHGVGFRV